MNEVSESIALTQFGLAILKSRMEVAESEVCPVNQFVHMLLNVAVGSKLPKSFDQ